MDPLITNPLDPALLRVLDKRTNDQQGPPRRRRNPPQAQVPETSRETEEDATEKQEHKLDDLA